MDAREDFWTATPAELAVILNGCGPSSWSDSLRDCASWVYRNFPEAIAVHDFDYEYADGVIATLVKVNQRFHDNNVKKLDFLYPLSKPWLYPIRAMAWLKVQFAFFALKNGSESAWISAHERLNPGPLEPLLSENTEPATV